MKLPFHRISLIFVVFAIFTLAVRIKTLDHKTSNYTNGQIVHFSTVLMSEPQISGNYQTFVVATPENDKISVRTGVSPQLHYGQKVSILGTISIKSVPGIGNSSTSLLSQKKPVTAIYSPQIEIDKTDSAGVGQKSLAMIGNLRQKATDFFENSLESPDGELMLGIVFGISSQMPKVFMDNLRTAGVVHVIAASGMNVTMIAEFLLVFLGLFLRRQIAITLAIVGIFLYAAFAGFEPSILRASIMGSLAFVAQILGRQTLAFFNLFLTAYVMLMISPQLVADIGFQLSFLATLGLIFIKPRLDSLPFFQKLGWLGEADISTTIAAQLATLPVLLANFGIYSLFSLVANALVLWMIPFLMIVGAVSVVSSFVFQGLGHAFLLLAVPPLWYFKEIVSFFGTFRPFEIASVSWEMVVGYYLVLLSFLLLARKSGNQS